MFKTFPMLMSVMLVPTIAVAAQSRMTCKNAFRTYVAVFDHKAKTFKLSSAGKLARYRVRRVQQHPYGYVVSGKTVARGPNFIAYLGRNRRIEFLDNGKVFQIDKCR